MWAVGAALRTAPAFLVKMQVVGRWPTVTFHCNVLLGCDRLAAMLAERVVGGMDFHCGDWLGVNSIRRAVGELQGFLPVGAKKKDSLRDRFSGVRGGFSGK